MNSINTVYINSIVNDIFGKFDMKQTFENNKDSPIELKIEIPIIKGMYLNEIKCKFNGKEYLSEIYPKQKQKKNIQIPYQKEIMQYIVNMTKKILLIY